MRTGESATSRNHNTEEKTVNRVEQTNAEWRFEEPTDKLATSINTDVVCDATKSIVPRLENSNIYRDRSRELN